MKILIDYQNSHIYAFFPYNEEVLQIVRALDVRQFDWDKRAWKIGLGCLKEFEQKVTELGHTVTYSPSYTNTFQKKVTMTEESYLFPYQKDGVEFLLSRPHSLLGDEMGLGKTVQALVMIKQQPQHILEKGVLILVPLSNIRTWNVENKKFTNLSITTIRGSKANRAKQWSTSSNIFLTNHETIRNDDIKKEWGLIIVDEASRFKNPETKLYSSLMALKGDLKIGMTGSPIENSLKDLYSIVNWLSPNIFPSYGQFCDKFLERNLRQIGGQVFWEITGYKNLDEAQRLISPIFLRRENKDVDNQLPPLRKQTIWCEFSSKEKDQLKEYEDAIRKLQEKKSPVLGEIVKMRVLCSGVENKLDEATEIIKGVSGQVVIFTEFHNAIDGLIKRLRDEGISYRELSGRISHTNRDETLKLFQQNDFKVLICQTKVGGYGLNLQNASTTIFLNRPYTIATENQAIARLYRMGQEGEHVLVYYLLTTNSFEERVNEILEAKKDLTDAVIVSSVVNRK